MLTWLDLRDMVRVSLSARFAWDLARSPASWRTTDLRDVSWSAMFRMFPQMLRSVTAVSASQPLRMVLARMYVSVADSEWVRDDNDAANESGGQARDAIVGAAVANEERSARPPRVAMRFFAIRGLNGVVEVQLITRLFPNLECLVVHSWYGPEVAPSSSSPPSTSDPLRLVFDCLAKLRRLVCPTKWLVTSPSPIRLPATLESLYPRGDARVALDTVIELDVRDATGLNMLLMGDLYGCKWRICAANERAAAAAAAAAADIVDTEHGHAVDFRIPVRATPPEALEHSRRPVSPSVGDLLRSLRCLSLSSGTFAGGMPEIYALATLPVLERLLVARLPDHGLAEWPSTAEPKPGDTMAGVAATATATTSLVTATATTPSGGIIDRPRMRRLQVHLSVSRFDHVARMLATYSGLRELRLTTWSSSMANGICDVVAECAAMKSGSLRYVRLPLFDGEKFSCPPAATVTAAPAISNSVAVSVSSPASSPASSSSSLSEAADVSLPPPLPPSVLEVGIDALYWYADDIFAFVPVTAAAAVVVAASADSAAVDAFADVVAVAATSVGGKTMPGAHIEVPTKRNTVHARTVHVVVRDESLAAIMRRGTCVVAFSATSSLDADLWADHDTPRVGALTCAGGRAPKRAGKLDREFRRRGPGTPYACLCEIPRRRWRKQYADAAELLSMSWIGGRTTEADVESDDDSDDDSDDEEDDDDE